MYIGLQEPEEEVRLMFLLPVSILLVVNLSYSYN